MEEMMLAVAAWDGRSRGEIEAVAIGHRDEPGYLDHLVTLIRADAPDLERGVTWLLKYEVERGARLPVAEANALWRRLPSLQHWESELHLLQCLPHLPVSKSIADSLADYLRDRCTSKRTFLRAWAHGGFVLLGQRHERFSAEAERLVTIAMASESASVRARLRRVIAGGR